MPWDISFVKNGNNDSAPLGPRDWVIQRLANALPGANLVGPPAVPAEILAIMPPIIRESLNHPKLEATFEHSDFLIQFYCRDSDPITFLNAEVRGNGDPFPALKALCDSTGWHVWDSSARTIVDLTKTGSNAWNKFCEWRDRAFNEAIRES